MTLGKMCISTSVIKIESSDWYHFNPLLTGYLRIPILDTYNRNPKHQRALKDGRVFGFRARKGYSEIFEFCNIAVGKRKVFQMKWNKFPGRKRGKTFHIIGYEALPPPPPLTFLPPLLYRYEKSENHEVFIKWPSSLWRSTLVVNPQFAVLLESPLFHMS